jgi:hypothetical protein
MSGAALPETSQRTFARAALMAGEERGESERPAIGMGE